MSVFSHGLRDPREGSFDPTGWQSLLYTFGWESLHGLWHHKVLHVCHQYAREPTTFQRGPEDACLFPEESWLWWYCVLRPKFLQTCPTFWHHASMSPGFYLKVEALDLGPHACTTDCTMSPVPHRCILLGPPCNLPCKKPFSFWVKMVPRSWNINTKLWAKPLLLWSLWFWIMTILLYCWESHGFIKVCVCVCVCVCGVWVVCTHMCPHTCVSSGGFWISFSFVLHIVLLFETGSLAEPGHHWFNWFAVQWASEVHLSLCCQHWATGTSPYLPFPLGCWDQNSSPCVSLASTSSAEPSHLIKSSTFTRTDASYYGERLSLIDGLKPSLHSAITLKVLIKIYTI
jgi:hypothetical protein